LTSSGVLWRIAVKVHDRESSIKNVVLGLANEKTFIGGI
jgi:hypothetical protein